MTLWYKRTETPGFRVDPVNLDVSPSPTVMAGGIGGGNCSQYFIEDDGMNPTKSKVSKPPYRVPSMAEIEALPWNGYSVVSSFSGTGGSCLGYRLSGFKVRWASEFIPAAQACYKVNHPDSILDTRDIRKVQPAEILDAIGMKAGDIDIFDGSPPCASFSTAGKREAGWGKVKSYSDSRQRTDDLFFEYARLLEGLQPRTFVAENVSGLIKGTAKGYFLEILARLKGCGYRVSARVLDAQWLGVPQMRQRLIFVGVREDLKIDPVHPRPLTYRYSVRDAIPWIIKIEVRNGQYATSEQPARTVRQSDGSRPTTTLEIDSGHVEAETDISRYAIGAEWDKLKPGGQSERYFQLVKPGLESPCPTITQRGGDNTVASVCHPTEKRKFSIAELKRICAFPDDFKLVGSYAQQWERLGRAVPPIMMSYVASTIRDEILCKLPKTA